MPYIIGLFIILGLIFSGFSGTANIGRVYQQAGDLAAMAFNTLKAKIGSMVFPKNQREILIENMASDYNILDRFFSQSTKNILNSKDVSEKDKTAVKEAINIFNKSKNDIAELGRMEKEDKSIIKSAVEKVLNGVPANSIGPAQPGAAFTPSSPAPSVFNQAIPTVIPPYCRVECSAQ